MKKVYRILFISLSFLLPAVYSCNRQTTPDTAKPGNENQNTFTVKGSVHEIFINHDEPDFPEGEGKELFASTCMMCHTLRYISTQPNFPRKTWEAEVNKMITKFHAPIDSVNAVKIVDYLVKVKGTNMTAAK